MLQELRFETLNWREFEQMIASLLEAEGFINVISAGGSGGDMGLDISAEELRRSLSGQISSFRWMVQVKHHGDRLETKGKARLKNVGHKEITEIVTFLSEHKAQGFLLITDTDLTSEAVKKITSFHEDLRHPFESHFWNRRMLSDRLRRHPELILRYFSCSPKAQGQISQNPYKFLESFKLSDRHLFFGRDMEIQEVAGLIYNSPIVVLFGESGTGKTSLLNAGLLPQLADQHFLTIYARCLDTPVQAIRREILRGLRAWANDEELVQISETADLGEFFRRVLLFLDGTQSRMIVALDQFEEAFTRAGERERQLLAEGIRALSFPNNSRGTLTLVFSIREDYLGSLWEWSHQYGLADTWRNAYGISRLTADRAELAITEPLNLINRTFEKDLIRKLLQDLERIGNGRIYPPYIQIVCGRLVEVHASIEVIPKSSYDEAGGAESIIGDYLDERLFLGLSANYAELARQVLDSLTGGQGLRTLLSLDEIQASTGIDDRTQLTEVIDFLVQRRVVTPSVEENDLVAGFEIVHDFLSRRFFERLNPTQKRERAIRDIFRRTYNDWKVHGMFASKTSLDEFFLHRESLLIGPEQAAMIIESAFVSLKYALWRDYLQERGYLADGIRYVLKNGKDPTSIEVALKQIRYVKGFNDLSLVFSKLEHERIWVRAAAVKALGRMRKKAAVPRIIEILLKEKSSWFLAEAADALRLIGDEKAIPYLEQQLLRLPQKGEPGFDSASWAHGRISEALARLKKTKT